MVAPGSRATPTHTRPHPPASRVQMGLNCKSLRLTASAGATLMGGKPAEGGRTQGFQQRPFLAEASQPVGGRTWAWTSMLWQQVPRRPPGSKWGAWCGEARLKMGRGTGCSGLVGTEHGGAAAQTAPSPCPQGRGPRQSQDGGRGLRVGGAAGLSTQPRLQAWDRRSLEPRGAAAWPAVRMAMEHGGPTACGLTPHQGSLMGTEPVGSRLPFVLQN